MPTKKIQTYFFISILVGSLALTMYVFAPYLVPLAFGGVLAVVCRPVFRGINKVVRSDMAAALLTVVLVTLAFIVPLAFFFIALSDELVVAAGNVSGYFNSASITDLLQDKLPTRLHPYIPEISREAVATLRAMAQFLSSNVAGFFSNVVGIIAGMAVVFIAFYYLLKDGAAARRKFNELSPLGKAADEALIAKMTSAVSAVMGGLVIVALLKGIIAGVAFAVFGLPAPLFWGVMTAFSALIPIVGTSLVTVPAVAYLLLTGHYWAALGVGLVTVFIVGTIDNVIQPKLVESKTNIHPLLVLLSILGGLQVYGFTGFILGPLTLTIAIALLDIYKKHFSDEAPEPL